MSTTFPEGLTEARSSRHILFVSLALNLFVLGVIGAFAIRHYVLPPPVAGYASSDRSMAGRIGRIAATLPPADADTMRNLYRAQSAAIEPRQDALRAAQNAVRLALRAQPFNADALQAAMTDARLARIAFYQATQDFTVAVAAAISPEGRSRLADWPPGSRSGSTPAR